jgi:hypothetical protein
VSIFATRAFAKAVQKKENDDPRGGYRYCIIGHEKKAAETSSLVGGLHKSILYFSLPFASQGM